MKFTFKNLFLTYGIRVLLPLPKPSINVVPGNNLCPKQVNTFCIQHTEQQKLQQVAHKIIPGLYVTKHSAVHFSTQS
jgi:hypothetical protein